MTKDPRAEFMRRSDLLADGRPDPDTRQKETIQDVSWEERRQLVRQAGIPCHADSSIVGLLKPDPAGRLDDKELDLNDPRQRFVRDSRALGDGKSLSDVRALYADQISQDDLDPRERFIRDAQRLAEGEDIKSIIRSRRDWVRSRKVFRADDRRLETSGRLFQRPHKRVDIERFEEEEAEIERLKEAGAL